MHKVKIYTRQLMNDSLYRNSMYLFIGNMSLAITGFLFWTIAARLFPAAEVGITSTIIAAATFIASASLFGLDHTLIHYLGKHADKAAAIMHAALTIVTVGSLLFSIGYLLIVPAITPELAFILSSPLWITAFIGLMIITTWNNVLNSTFIAFRVTHFILAAGLLFGIGRIILLALFNDDGLRSLLGSHSISFATGVFAGVLSLFVIKKYLYKPYISGEVVKLMRGYSLRTYAASLLASMPPLITPLLVIGILGAPEAAYYNMPLLMVGLLNMIAMATSQSLFAEGVHNSNQIKKQVMKSIKLIYMLLIPAVIAVIGGGYIILGIFGASYAEHGYMLLVFLSVATLFKAGSFPLIAIMRILGEIKEIIIATSIYVTCIIFGTYIALATIGQLWAIGLAVLISEAVLLGIYAGIVGKRWKHSTQLDPNAAEKEIQI